MSENRSKAQHFTRWPNPRRRSKAAAGLGKGVSPLQPLLCDDIEDPLPFDINAPVIDIRDEDFALWYRDVTEEPTKYHGKTVCFKGQVAMLRREKKGMFAPGRFVMTCCVDDIEFCGIPCAYERAAELKPRSWVKVTAKITAEKLPLYKGELGPVLTALEVLPADPAEPDVATF